MNIPYDSTGMRGLSSGVFAVLIAAALLSSLTLAVFESSVSNSVQASASGSGGGSSQSSSSVIINGQPVSNTSVSSTGSGDVSSGASVISSSVSGGSTADLDAAVQDHFTHLDKIVTDMQTFGVSSSFIGEAKATLQSEEQQWIQASTTQQKQVLINSINAYWSDLRQRLKASGAAYDFDAQLALSDVGGVTTVASSSGSAGSTSRSSVASATTPASVSPSAQATNGVLNNVIGQNHAAQTQESPSSTTASAQGGGFFQAFANGLGSVTASIGLAIGGLFNAIGHLFG